MRSALLALAVLLAGACSSLPEPAVHPSGAPLRAMIHPPMWGGGAAFGFELSRPAYVALFDVVPGAGVSMLYPGFGSGTLDGRAFAGSTILSRVRPRNLEQYRFAGLSLAGQPHFLLLIASERPLDVERFGSFGYGLQRELGVRFASLDAYATMEQLARLTVPDVEDGGSWTSDLYVYWPQVIPDRLPGTGSYVVLRCDGEYEVLVRADRLLDAQRVLCPVERREEKPDSARPPERPSVPGRRKPQAPEAPTAPEGRQQQAATRAALRRDVAERAGLRVERLRERIGSSAQLSGSEPSSRAPGVASGRIRPERRPWGADPGSRVRPGGGSPGYTSGSSAGTREPAPAAAPAAAPAGGAEPRSAPPPPPAHPQAPPAPTPRESGGR